jgi:hypothetical protein
MILTGAVCVHLAGSASLAKKNGGGKSSPAAKPAPPPPPPANPAYAELADAKRALKVIHDKLFAAYQQTQPWADATTKVSSARDELEAAKKAAREALSSNPDYQAAVAAKQKAQDDLTAAKASPDSTPESITGPATAVMEASGKISALENDAFSNDSAIIAAQANVTAAKAGLDAEKQEFEASLPSDPDYAAAKKLVDDVQKKVDALHPQPTPAVPAQGG